MQTLWVGPDNRNGVNRTVGTRRHQAWRAAVALAVVAMVASACGSSTKLTASTVSHPTNSGIPGAGIAKGTGSVAAIAGTWTSINGDAVSFCQVGSAIGPDDAPVTSQPTGCDLGVSWSVVNRFKVDERGYADLSFLYQGMSHGNTDEPADATHEGTCKGTVKIAGEQLGFDGLECQQVRGDNDNLNTTALADAPWKLDGSCLEIEHVWFEQTRGECADHDGEQKFGEVGNAIENAS